MPLLHDAMRRMATRSQALGVGGGAWRVRDDYELRSFSSATMPAALFTQDGFGVVGVGAGTRIADGIRRALV